MGRDVVRVAMVCARAVPLMGGVETHVQEVSRRLAASGVEVSVLTTDTSGELPADEMVAGFRIRRWAAYPRSRDFYLAPGLARHLWATTDYDVVHIQGVHSLVAPVALAATRRSRIPSVLTFHTGGHSSRVRTALRPLQWKALAPLLRSAAALVAVSEYEQHSFGRIPGLADIRLIRNGCEPLPVDPEAKAPPGNPLLVSVGRLERYKGHHRVLQALPAILDRAPDARLVVVGSGPYGEALREMADELGVAERFSIEGFGPDQRGQLGALVASADVMCLLSDYEAHPIAVTEALGVGTGVLAADTSGLSELGRAGLISTVPLGASPEQVAIAALAVAAQPAHAPPRLPTWDACAEQLLRLYREVVR